MRLFFIGWDGVGTEYAEIAEALTKQNHTIIYWTSSSVVHKIDRAKFPGTIFHDLADALAVKSAPGVVADFPVPSTSLLEQLYETESIVLTMMNKKYEWMSIGERKQVYYKMLQYWAGVLELYAPDVVIFPVVPHTVYDYVIYALCKLQKIRTIMFDLTRVNDERLLVIEDFKVGSQKLQTALVASTNKQVATADLDSDIREYYQKQVTAQSAENRMPLDVVGLVSEYAGLKRVVIKISIIIKSIFDLTIFNKLAIFFSKVGRSNLKKEYTSLEVKPDLAKKFVYVPLNYQPERTTSPTGGIYVDQLLMIQTLSQAVPADWVIYVKEHPYQWLPRGLNYFSYRYRGFYETIAKLRNVQLIPLSTSNYELIDRAVATATVTGTAGWEGLFRGKPVILFGYPWYQHAPGIFKVNSLESCRQAFAVIKSGFTVPSEAMIKYLYSFQQVSFRGYVDTYGQKICRLTPEENKKNFITALSDALTNTI